MMQEELISKKDLLLETGISYGQLYRWKRQHLIPDSWFIKKSSFTGQETFFPKEKILARIQAILEMKDAHSLDELAAMFTPTSVDRNFVLMDVSEAIGLRSSLVEMCIKVWEKYRFTFLELLMIDLLAELDMKQKLTEEEIKGWLLTAKRWTSELSGADRQILICRKKNVLLYFMLDVPARFSLDQESQLIAAYDLSERSKDLQIKLQNMMEG